MWPLLHGPANETRVPGLRVVRPPVSQSSMSAWAQSAGAVFPVREGSQGSRGATVVDCFGGEERFPSLSGRSRRDGGIRLRWTQRPYWVISRPSSGCALPPPSCQPCLKIVRYRGGRAPSRPVFDAELAEEGNLARGGCPVKVAWPSSGCSSRARRADEGGWRRGLVMS